MNDLPRVSQHPAPQRHAVRERQNLGVALPMLSDHELARQTDRHARRNRELS